MIQNLQKQHGFQYAAMMTTNGYLLDEKLFRQFCQAGITSYQITLDAVSYTHLPAVVRTSRETGEKNTSPLSREVRSSCLLYTSEQLFVQQITIGGHLGSILKAMLFLQVLNHFRDFQYLSLIHI